MISRCLRGAAAVLLLGITAGCTDDHGSGSDPVAPQNLVQVELQALSQAVAAHETEVAASLRAIPGVVGSGVGKDADGEPVIEVYLETRAVAGIPEAIEGFRTRSIVTGRIHALSSNPQSRARPVPVGYSVGHPAVTAGTFGARVEGSGGAVYMLSNNHVIAASNAGQAGDPILQPGPDDGGTAADSVAWLTDYEPIDFGGGPNTIDAAIASASPSTINFWTPPADAYGPPGSGIFGDDDGDGFFDDATELINVPVQKYGRTTSHTTATVAAVGVQASICYDIYCTKSAVFVDQIRIGDNGFSDRGDSGSLIVTDDYRRSPVGLLFAGDTGSTFANRIDLVLDRFNVTVDAGDPLTLAVSGPQCLYSPGWYDFTATATGGAGGYTWAWARDKAPYDYWAYAAFIQSPSFYFDAGSYGERLRAEVTDAAGQSVASIHQVYMDSGYEMGTNATICDGGGPRPQ